MPFVVLVLWLSGCAGIPVVPPSDPESPVPVFLLDHGRHSSLVLPTGDGGLVRYSYGDWNYYALRRTGFSTALAALLGPTEAAMGRRELPGPPQQRAVRRQVLVEIERLFELQVAGEDAARLRTELEAKFEAAIHTRIYNPDMDLELVRHPVPYTFTHNSNRVVADWLTRLGVEVRGRPILSNWVLVGE